MRTKRKIDMADFKRFAVPLLEREGGFVDHPSDKGGPTNRGITLNTFREHYGKDRGVEDLRNMTDAQWEHIIRTGYWDRCRADDIASQSVAEIIVDWYVNSGSVAVRRVQEIVNVRPDSKAGPVTVAAINAADARALFERIREARKTFYRKIVERDPSQSVFLKGWLGRIDGLRFNG